MEQVGVPSDDDIDEALLDRREEPLIAGPALPGEGADVVVGVDVDELPAVAVDEGAAVVFLAGDAEAFAFGVLGDADVAAGALAGHGTSAPWGCDKQDGD